MRGPDHAAELAADFAALGPFGTCDRLGLKHRREGRTAFVCCPWHAEKTPSCTVAIGQAGTIRVHCFACARTWDVHALVAQLRGLDCAGDFRSVLLEEAELLGRSDIAAALEGRAAERGARGAAWSSGHFLFFKANGAGHELSRTAPPRPAPQPEPERTYPPAAEVADLWAACKLVTTDDEVSAWLRSRALEPDAVAVRDLARALPRKVALPRWAWGPGGSWADTGHRMIVGLYDAGGVMRTVRAGRIIEGNTPKRLPPAGHKAGQVVMADTVALEVLRLGKAPDYIAEPLRIIIAEGEPDWLTWATNRPLDSRKPPFGVLGILAGAWCAELAARIPSGAHVIIRTDHDQAGEKYAADIIRTLASRCTVRRSRPTP